MALAKSSFFAKQNFDSFTPQSGPQSSQPLQGDLISKIFGTKTETKAGEAKNSTANPDSKIATGRESGDSPRQLANGGGGCSCGQCGGAGRQSEDGFAGRSGGCGCGCG